MISVENEPICHRKPPKMTIEELSPGQKPAPNDRNAKNLANNLAKNLSIQTEIISQKTPQLVEKAFDMKKYLNRNSPKYYNLKEKLANFEISAKNKNFEKNTRNAKNSSDGSAGKTAQNSTIDQTPQIVKEKGNSRTSSQENDADYENNFIIAKINDFFKENAKNSKEKNAKNSKENSPNSKEKNEKNSKEKSEKNSKEKSARL